MKYSFVSLAVLFFISSNIAEAQLSNWVYSSPYYYQTNQDNPGTVTIYSTTATNVPLTIPTTLDGYPVTGIGAYALNYSAAPSVIIPGSVTNICTNALPTSATNVVLNSGLVTISGGAFNFLMHLTNVILPGTVKNIGSEAFFFCTNITHLIIPASVTNIGACPFGYSLSLTNIEVDPGNLYYASSNGVVYSRDYATLVAFPGGLGSSYQISNGVTSLAAGAFGYCKLLSNVVIPISVTNISGAFQSSAITNITIPSGVKDVGISTFYTCNNLKWASIPAGVTNIGADAFNYCPLMNIDFHGHPPTLGTNALSNGTVYYLTNTTGWSSTFGGRPTVPWSAQIFQPRFVTQGSYYGFNLLSTAGYPVEVQSCTNLSSPMWTNELTMYMSSASYFFSVPKQNNSGSHFYRVVLP